MRWRAPMTTMTTALLLSDRGIPNLMTTFSSPPLPLSLSLSLSGVGQL